MKPLLPQSLRNLAAILTMCLVTLHATAQQYSIVVTGDFESKCILPNEGQYYPSSRMFSLSRCLGFIIRGCLL